MERGRVLLERIDLDDLRARAEQVVGGTPAEADATVSIEKPSVSHAAFAALDLRIGEILAAEAVQGADRLYRLSIDIGSETRVCVSGLRDVYDAEELVGRRAVVVANLEPATIRGIRSECMLLAADDGNGPALLAVDREVEPGTPIV